MITNLLLIVDGESHVPDVTVPILKPMKHSYPPLLLTP